MLAHIPLAPSFGAEVLDLDLRRLTPARCQALYALWKQHHVLLLRRQRLDDAAWRELAALFGELERSEGATRAADAEWQSVGSHLLRPPVALLAHAGEAPPAGALWFASLGCAVRSMPVDLVSRLRRLAVQHVAPHAQQRSANDDPGRSPCTVHPLVIVHPETGEHALHLGRRRHSWFAGLPLDESERLLNIVWSYATAPAVTWRHAWRPGDVLVWNNLTTLHRHEGAGELQRAQSPGRYVLSAPIQQEAA